MTSRTRIIGSIGRRSAARCALTFWLAWVFAYAEAKAQNSWQQTGCPVRCLAISAARYIFTGTENSRFFRPTISGNSWAILDTGLANQPVRIRFKRGETTVTLHGHLAIGETKRYVLSVFAGQTMRVIFSPPWESELVIVGQDGTVLKSRASGGNFWRGKLPSTQDYFIDLTVPKSAQENKDFELSVLVNLPGQTTKWITHRDEKAGFELRYSDYFIPDAEPNGRYTGAGRKAIFSLDFIGNEFFEGTNLRQVSFFIATSNEVEIDSSLIEEAEIDSTCTSCDDREGALGQEVINSVTYRKCEYIDHDMGGRRYRGEIYRTIHNNTCYEVGFVIYDGSVDMERYNNPDSDIREFDQGGVLQKLREVLSTFKLIKQ